MGAWFLLDLNDPSPGVKETAEEERVTERKENETLFIFILNNTLKLNLFLLTTNIDLHIVNKSIKNNDKLLSLFPKLQKTKCVCAHSFFSSCCHTARRYANEERTESIIARCTLLLHQLQFVSQS